MPDKRNSPHHLTRLLKKGLWRDLFAKYEEMDVQRALVDVNDKIIEIEKAFEDVMDIFIDVASKEEGTVGRHY